MKYVFVWVVAAAYLLGLLMGKFYSEDPLLIQRTALSLVGTCIALNVYDLARTRCTKGAAAFITAILILAFALVAFAAVSIPEIF